MLSAYSKSSYRCLALCAPCPECAGGKFLDIILNFPLRCSLLDCTAPRRRPSRGFRLHAGTHTCTRHTTRRSARLLHEQIHVRTNALHLHGRRTYAGLLCRLPSHLMLTCSPLDGRVAPRRAPLASPLRRSRRRERPHGCRRCRRAARLCTYHCRCRRQGTCESRTGDSDSRPTPLPVSAAVADAGREQRAGRRARRVGGMPTSAAGGARAQMPWRMVRDASPSSRTDDPAHAWAVRGAEVTGREHHGEEKQGRVGGTARACGTVGRQN